MTSEKDWSSFDEKDFQPSTPTLFGSENDAPSPERSMYRDMWNSYEASDEEESNSSSMTIPCTLNLDGALQKKQLIIAKRVNLESQELMLKSLEKLAKAIKVAETISTTLLSTYAKAMGLQAALTGGQFNTSGMVEELRISMLSFGDLLSQLDDAYGLLSFGEPREQANQRLQSAWRNNLTNINTLSENQTEEDFGLMDTQDNSALSSMISTGGLGGEVFSPLPTDGPTDERLKEELCTQNGLESLSPPMLTRQHGTIEEYQKSFFEDSLGPSSSRGSRKRPIYLG